MDAKQEKQKSMTVKMMKVAAAVSVAMCLGTASAQQTISVNFGQQGASEVPQAGGDTVKVQGRGVGANRDEARHFLQPRRNTKRGFHLSSIRV